MANETPNPNTILGMTHNQLATYLEIALAQRERAANKARTDYGPESAVTNELQSHVATLTIAIAELRQPKLPLRK